MAEEKIASVTTTQKLISAIILETCFTTAKVHDLLLCDIYNFVIEDMNNIPGN